MSANRENATAEAKPLSIAIAAIFVRKIMEVNCNNKKCIYNNNFNCTADNVYYSGRRCQTYCNDHDIDNLRKSSFPISTRRNRRITEHCIKTFK